MKLKIETDEVLIYLINNLVNYLSLDLYWRGVVARKCPELLSADSIRSKVTGSKVTGSQVTARFLHLLLNVARHVRGSGDTGSHLYWTWTAN